MSRAQSEVWRCDLCGHKWIAQSDNPPEKCAKCRKRRWHKVGDKVKKEK